jgi:5-methylcytosine-specific restriction protein A
MAPREPRRTAHQRGYDRRWGKRAAAFRIRYPFCGMRPKGQAPVMSRCFEEGRRTPAFQVDHVVPHRGNRQLFDDEIGNWQSLCQSCGAAKSKAGL